MMSRYLHLIYHMYVQIILCPLQWNDIDAMKTNNDFTIDDKNFADLPKFVEHLHKIGMKYIPMFDPGISASERPGTYPPYDLGMTLDIFVKNSTGQPFIGILIAIQLKLKFLKSNSLFI